VGARVELSGATLDNWVAKTANLFRDDLGLGVAETVLLAPTHHWLTPVVLLGAWRAGVVVSLDNSAGAAVALGSQAALAGRSELPAEAFALSEDPLGLPEVGRITDFVAEVRGQAERFIPYVAPDPEAVILVTSAGPITAASLVADALRRVGLSGLKPGDRLLVTTALTSADSITAGLLAPLAAYSTVVLGRNLGEPPDVGLITGERVSHIMAGESPWEIRPLAS
jgi:uncharacterized protein (TIGR03089 family)